MTQTGKYLDWCDKVVSTFIWKLYRAWTACLVLPFFAMSSLLGSGLGHNSNHFSFTPWKNLFLVLLASAAAKLSQWDCSHSTWGWVVHFLQVIFLSEHWNKLVADWNVQTNKDVAEELSEISYINISMFPFTIKAGSWSLFTPPYFLGNDSTSQNWPKYVPLSYNTCFTYQISYRVGYC